MKDLIATLHARCEERVARDDELRQRLKQFEALLKEAVTDENIYGRSEDCKIQDYGSDDYYYGFLSFNGSLRIAYRTSEEDLTEQDDPYGPAYQVIDLDRCDAAWLRALATPSVMDSLAISLISRVERDVEASVRGVRAIDGAANLPLRELETGMVDVANKLGYGKVLEQWQKAQAALGVDASEAVTRASQLVETLCKHILDSKGRPVEAAPDVQKLFRAVLKVVDLNPDPKICETLTKMSSGLITVVLAICTLRNHAGIAHGANANSVPVTPSQARLVVNAAGVLATFLMDTMLQVT